LQWTKEEEVSFARVFTEPKTFKIFIIITFAAKFIYYYLLSLLNANLRPNILWCLGKLV